MSISQTAPSAQTGRYQTAGIDDRAIDDELARLEQLADLLDARFRLPGTPIRFGLDSIVGLIPGIGDIAVTVPSAWMVWRGYRMGLRKRHLTRMGINTAVDYVIGSIPLIGDIFDVGFKANLRNAAILREELEKRRREPR